MFEERKIKIGEILPTGCLTQINQRTNCKNLAPHIFGKCEASFLISVGDYSGGSIGWDMSYNIYGLFSFNEDKKFIIPLKNFYKKNNAVNYLRSIN